MTDEEIITARRQYESALWAAFGETLLIMPDAAAARAAYNERTQPLRDALPAEVRCTLREWQR